MAEWLNTSQMARATGYSASHIASLASGGFFAPEHVRITHGKYRGYYQISADVIQMLIEHKQEWHAEIKQPDGVIHVPDPLDIQEGLWLTPDEARRLIAIRRNKRIYGDTWACNRQLINALMTVREYIGDG